MFESDPISIRQLHTARLIEGEQARNQHKVVYPRGNRPHPGRRLVAMAKHLSFVPRRTYASPLDPSLEPFAGMDRKALRRLSQHLSILGVPAGTSLGRQGEIADRFVIVLSGRVGVTIDGVPEAVLDEGSHFAAMPLLDHSTNALQRASFSTMVPSRLACASPEQFRTILAEFPLVAYRINQIVDARRAYLARRMDRSNADQAITQRTGTQRTGAERTGTDRTVADHLEAMKFPVHIGG